MVLHKIYILLITFKFGIIWSDSAHDSPGTCRGNPARPRLNSILRDRSIWRISSQNGLNQSIKRAWHYYHELNDFHNLSSSPAMLSYNELISFQDPHDILQLCHATFKEKPTSFLFYDSIRYIP